MHTHTENSQQSCEDEFNFVEEDGRSEHPTHNQRACASSIELHNSDLLLPVFFFFRRKNKLPNSPLKHMDSAVREMLFNRALMYLVIEMMFRNLQNEKQCCDGQKLINKVRKRITQCSGNKYKIGRSYYY